jgi:hypothetical protein
MAKGRTWLVTGVVALGAAFIAGYWPEARQRRGLERERAILTERVADLEARVRVARLLGDLLYLAEMVAAMNYGEAQTLSTRFFDDVSAEAARTPVGDFKAALEQVARQRDLVTAALARGDPAARDSLDVAQLALRRALGYPTMRAAGTPATAPP